MTAKVVAAASVLLCALCLAACASQDDGYQRVAAGQFGRGGGGDPARARRGLPNTFISPAGKPYRAAAGEPYPVAAWFAAADADHDGRLTLAEFRADAAAFFVELDTNHDGVIDGAELQRYEQQVAPEILPAVEGLASGEGMDLALGRGRGGGRAGPQIGAAPGSPRNGAGPAGREALRPQGAGLFSLSNEPEPVAACDTNFDGKIKLDAFLAAADRRFATLDNKNTGTLTLAGLPKTPVQEAIEQAAKAAKKSPSP